MSKNIEIKSVFKIKNVGDNVSISGWVKHLDQIDLLL